MKIASFLCLAIVLLFSSCVSREHYILFQDANDYQDAKRIASTYDIRIQADDQLAISIASKDKELVDVFNNQTFIGAGQNNTFGMTNSNMMNGNNGGLGAINLSGFHVDNEGYIEFPILGRIYVEGKSRKDVADDIARRLRDGQYINDAVVNVELLSFHVVVIRGNEGKVLNIGKDRCTVIEAITMAGGFQNGNDRRDVLVVREENGELWTYRLDFTMLSNLVNSPVYYLQQNDVIYIEPAGAQQVEESSAYRYLSAFSAIFSVIVSVGAIVLTLNK
ncbi:MAG: polysaccharide biosynthesis/export family protein [Bacteroidales bacterium]|nr:polysaccharide biosynthesis/export family protein [Bacteroidales bacterium]